MAEANKVFKTPEFRVSFPSVFEMSTYGGKPKYTITMLFPKGTDLGPMKKAMKEVAKAKYGDNLPAGFKWPLFRSGAEKERYDGYDDSIIFVKASSAQRKPGVVSTEIDPNTNMFKNIGPEEFYAGCHAIASLTAYCYEHIESGTKGVSFGLQNLQKQRDGEPFSPRTNAENDFAPMEDAFNTEDDPTF